MRRCGAPPEGIANTVAKRPQRRWSVERLQSAHDRSQFDCGQPQLNDWLRLRASQSERRDLARVYVALPQETSVVAGYYALSSHRVTFDVLPTEQAKGLPHLGVPVVLLGQLAVDQNYQGQGLGSFLLLDALHRAEQISQHLGVRAVEVVALDEPARRFYLHYGFMALRDDPHHLFLPMQVIRRLKLSSS